MKNDYNIDNLCDGCDCGRHNSSNADRIMMYYMLQVKKNGVWSMPKDAIPRAIENSQEFLEGFDLNDDERIVRISRSEANHLIDDGYFFA